MKRMRAGGKEHDVARQLPRSAVACLDVDSTTSAQPAVPVDDIDGVAIEVVAHLVFHQRSDLRGARAEHLDHAFAIDHRRNPVEVSLAKPGDVQRSLPQRLGGDAAVPYHDTAHPRGPFDDGDPAAEVRGVRRGLLTRGAGADHDDVVGVDGRTVLRSAPCLRTTAG